MSDRRCNDVHNVGRLRYKKFLRSFETLDPWDDLTHGGLRRIGRICHGHQLRTRATQNRARMMLRMAARTKKCDADGSIRHDY